MPANSFLTNDIVTYEALDVLENTYNAMIHINSEYSDQFEFGGTVLGQTLSIRKPPRYIGRLGQAAQIEAITETFVPLTLSYQRGVDTQVSSQQLTLDIDNYRTRVLMPQIVRVSNLIDQDVCGLAQGLNQSVGTPGTTPTTLATYLAAKTKLDNLAAPMDGGRCMFLNPSGESSIVDNLKGLFQASADIAEQYRTGMMARTIGFDWYMDQNIYVQTVGTLGGTPTVTTTPSNGATTIVTGSWTSTTLNAGDVVSFVSATTPVNSVNPQSYQSTGQTAQFVVTATITDTANSITIPVAPAFISSGQLQNITNLPAGTTPVYVYDTPAASFSTISAKQAPQMLAVHKDFGTLAMVDMPLPGGTDKAYRAASRKSGKALRVIRDYVATSDQWIQRIDVLYGVAVLRQELGVRVQGGA
jgi:hypothetical protein